MYSTLLALTVLGVVPFEVDPGPYDAITEGIGAQVPLLLAALGLIVVAALGIVFFKWGVPQLIGFFRRIGK